jgi:hypothetical protein
MQLPNLKRFLEAESERERQRYLLTDRFERTGEQSAKCLRLRLGIWTAVAAALFFGLARFIPRPSPELPGPGAIHTPRSFI